MRVVLDTNVLISALVYKKTLGKIGDLIEQGRITPCFTISTWREFENVLRYPKLQPKIKSLDTSAKEIAQALTASKVLVFADPERVPNEVSEVGDNNILAAGIRSQASCTVTGDAELLALKQFRNIPIIAPQKFLSDWVK